MIVLLVNKPSPIILETFWLKIIKEDIKKITKV